MDSCATCLTKFETIRKRSKTKRLRKMRIKSVEELNFHQEKQRGSTHPSESLHVGDFICNPCYMRCYRKNHLKRKFNSVQDLRVVGESASFNLSVEEVPVVKNDEPSTSFDHPEFQNDDSENEIELSESKQAQAQSENSDSDDDYQPDYNDEDIDYLDEQLSDDNTPSNFVRKSRSGHSTCVFGCRPPITLTSVPYMQRLFVIIASNIFIPNGGRCCRSHLESDPNHWLDVQNAPKSQLTRAELNEGISMLRKELLRQNLNLNIKRPQDCNTKFYTQWTGLEPHQFRALMETMELNLETVLE